MGLNDSIQLALKMIGMANKVVNETKKAAGTAADAIGTGAKDVTKLFTEPNYARVNYGGNLYELKYDKNTDQYYISVPNETGVIMNRVLADPELRNLAETAYKNKGYMTIPLKYLVKGKGMMSDTSKEFAEIVNDYNNQIQNFTPSGGNGGGGTGGSSSSGNYNTSYNTSYNEAKIPRVYSADELAAYYGLADTYNLENLINLYNQKTNDYYDKAIKEQTDLRNNYFRNDYYYLENLLNETLNSYKYQAPTTAKRGIEAANYLNTLLGTGAQVGANDYNMLSSINNMYKAREAELANNPYLAQQYYDKLGTYLSDVSVYKNAADVKAYAAEQDAYAKAYDADRDVLAKEADAVSAKYNGLIDAAKIAADAQTYNYTNKSDQEKMYDYYYSMYGDAQMAAKAVQSTIYNKQGKY